MCTLIDAYVYFIFQPAEEGRAGARQMIDDGLFDLFPADCVFGLHNFPDVPQGHFAIKSGVMMASFDCFEIVLSGQATHAAMPQKGSDVFVAAAHIISACTNKPFFEKYHAIFMEYFLNFNSAPQKNHQFLRIA